MQSYMSTFFCVNDVNISFAATVHEFRMVDKDELDWGRTTQNRKRTIQAEYFIRRPRANTCLILDENKDENFFEVLTSNTTNYF